MGKHSHIRVYSHTMAAVQNDCRLWAKAIAMDFRPDIVVFPAKSGYLFAAPIAEELRIPMVDVLATRPGNETKDAIRQHVPWIPTWLLAIALKSKAMYGFNEANAERNVLLTERAAAIDWAKKQRILIVDDSVDTGWSIVAVRDLLKAIAPTADIRIASYCVIDMSKDRVKVDWLRYRNTIILTATSRYSDEHESFLTAYRTWCIRSQQGERHESVDV